MATERSPAPPKGLQAAGRKLWRSAVEAYELDEHELLDRLADEADGASLLIRNSRGDDVTNPLLAERRQQSIVLARLLAALRMPSGEEENRPQRRGGARGTYRIRPAS